MYFRCRAWTNLCYTVIKQNVKLAVISEYEYRTSCRLYPLPLPVNLLKFYAYHSSRDLTSFNLDEEYSLLPCDFGEESIVCDEDALRVQSLLGKLSKSSNEELFQALEKCELSVTEDLVLNVLKRHDSDWKSAFRFFNWVCSATVRGYKPRCGTYNKMLGILGKAKQFNELIQVFDDMFSRGLITERSYDIVVHRYAAAHKTDDAIEFFYKRKQYGLELDLPAFQTLLLSLCRYKHVEIAEALFYSKDGEFEYDIKTWNIILNGWYMLGNLYGTKRFWKVILRSKCKPDKYTYGSYINALCRSGKVGTALMLFQGMWKNGCPPDVVICNTMIDGLCFKKRIPEAIAILHDMNAKGCITNVATYNCLIKHMCKNRRVDMVAQLLHEMEMKGGQCTPNSMTYTFLLAAAKTPDEVSTLLERMKTKGCKLTEDIYNMLLRLYLSWNCEELVKSTWTAMLRNGMGPDRRSYIVMIHKRCDQGRIEEALEIFEQMISKGIAPEPRTNILVERMKIKLEMGGSAETY